MYGATKQQVSALYVISYARLELLIELKFARKRAFFDVEV